MQENISESTKTVLSPFSDANAHVFSAAPKRGLAPLIIFTSLLICSLGMGGFFLFRYINDPLRTLETFPASKYLEGYRSLAGSKFRANLRVENDLGWKDGTGRLMVFTVRDDPHPIVVMIPPAMAQTFFTKGQNYKAELEVKEGGLIYANFCQKD